MPQKAVNCEFKIKNMNVALLLLLLVAVLSGKVAPQCIPSVTTVMGTHAPSGQICSGQLIFEENFNSLDENKWSHEITIGGGGNGEFQWYVNDRSNSFTQDGNLVIRPTLTTDVYGDDFLYGGLLTLDPCTNPEWNGCEHYATPDYPHKPVRSARIRTHQSFSFKFGVLEVRARMPAGDWLWPAIWMLPTNNVYGTWPRSGEIDVLESRGNRYLFASGRHIGVEEFGSTLHFGTEWYNSAWWAANHLKNSPPGAGWNTNFHTFRLEWTPTGLTFLVDNVLVGQTIPGAGGFFGLGQFTGYNPWAGGTNMAPFDQHFHLILNLAVGGTNGFFPDGGNNSGKPWNNADQNPVRNFWAGRQQWLPDWRLEQNNAYEASLRVDYVRIWAL